MLESADGGRAKLGLPLEETLEEIDGADLGGGEGNDKGGFADTWQRCEELECL